MSAEDLFDKKFVLAATLIGFGYVAMVVLVGETLGKDAAGVAGVALTALAIAIFKQFESLRFKIIADGEGKEVSIPRASVFMLATLAFAFTGIEFFVWMSIRFTAAVLGAVSYLEERLFAARHLTPTLGLAISEMLEHWIFWSLAIIGTAAGCLVCAYCVIRSIPTLRYSTILYGVLVAKILSPSFAMEEFSIREIYDDGVAAVYLAAPFWFLYLVAALVGARLARPRLRQQCPV